MDILDSLIKIRKQNKCRQITLANSLSITSTSLSRYESRKREIPFSTLIQYAEYFEYEIRLLKKLQK